MVVAVAGPQPRVLSVGGTVTTATLGVTCSAPGVARVVPAGSASVVFEAPAEPTGVVTLSGATLQQAHPADGEVPLAIRCVVAGVTGAPVNATVSLDTTPPAPLAVFTAAPGDSQGAVVLTLQSADPDLARLELARAAGEQAPDASCLAADIVRTVVSPLPATLVDPTPANNGETFTYRACLYDAVGNLRSSQLVRSSAYDGAGPPALAAFAAAPGPQHAQVQLTVTYPADITAYARLQIRRGSAAPGASCNDGLVIHEREPPGFTSGLVVDTTESQHGEPVVYRVCIWDSSGNLTAMVPLEAQPADLVPPPPLVAFAAAPGPAHGDITLTLTYPPDLSDYATVRIHRGSVVPNCDSPVTEQLDAPFPTTRIQATGAQYGEVFHFRACIVDRAGNVTSTRTTSGPARDTVPPPGLDSLVAGPGPEHGTVAVTLTYPPVTTDIARVRVLRGASSCTNGVQVFSATPPVSNRVVLDQTGAQYGEPFSYLVCMEDTAQNLTVSGPATGNARDAVAPPAFAFQLSPGPNNGWLQVAVDFPTELTDFFRVDMVQVTGTGAGCVGVGPVVRSFTGDTGFADTTFMSFGHTPGSQVTLRACASDAVGNVRVVERTATAPTCLGGYPSNGACFRQAPLYVSCNDTCSLYGGISQAGFTHMMSNDASCNEVQQGLGLGSGPTMSPPCSAPFGCCVVGSERYRCLMGFDPALPINNGTNGISICPCVR